MLTISADLVNLILTFLVPVVTGLITKSTASVRVKAIVALLLSGVVTLISQARGGDGMAVLSSAMLYQWAMTIAIQLAVYLGVYKPIAPSTVQILPTIGLG